jgi:hypothetical protein
VTVTVPGGLEELTAAWVEAALNEGGQLPEPVAVTDLAMTRIGQDTGFLGHLARLTIGYDGATNGPATVVAKLPTDDPGGRAVGGMLDVWQRESRFFAELARRCDPLVPRCWYNGADPEGRRWTLLLEDRSGGPGADQVRGASDDQAAASVETLARLQTRFGVGFQPPPVGWLPSFGRPGFGALQGAMEAAIPVFVERYGDQVPARTLGWLAAFVEALPGWAAAQGDGPLTLVHADYRLDNLLFGSDGSVTVLDWQTALWGPPAMDLASLLGTSLTVEDRRRTERGLLDLYTEQLAVDRQVIEQQYRSCLLWWMAIYANNLSRIDPTDGRGRALFELMIDRAFQAADDWDAGSLLDA